MDINDVHIFKNCLEVKRSEDGLFPLRFTQKQLAEYSKKSQYEIRSLCPAGICIDIITDTSFIEFDYTILDRARDWYYFDIYCDGVLVSSIGTDSVQQKKDHFYYELPKFHHLVRLTIYLPQLVQIKLLNLKVMPGAIVEPAPLHLRNLLCLGDSITQGMEAVHPSMTYPVLLSRFLNMNLLNQAVGGYIFDSASLEGGIPFYPDLITVAYGTNDWCHGESLVEIQRKCSEYFTILKSLFPAIPIVVITPIWRSDWNEPKKTGTFPEIIATIRKICADFSEITVVDGLTLVPHLSEYFGDQYLHPNDTGFLYMALNLAKQIVPFI